MKRLLDIVLSMFLILLFSPILCIIAVLIKLSSKGPVIFRQSRVGVGRKLFNILKFRTMYCEAPKDIASHLLQGAKSYITPVGAFLRRSSLDELPQLFNILLGEMSFVGPRPALYNQYDLVELRDKYEINSIIPGVTGWAQINGRDEISIQLKVEHDKYYYDNRSLFLDAKIMFFTIFKVISASGVSEGKK